MQRIALITGVCGGIGAASAALFLRAGWRVIGVDVREAEPMPQVHRFIRADVASLRAWRRIAAEVGEYEGRVDAFVSNAAIQVCKPLIDTSFSQWKRVMATNAGSVYLGVRHLHLLLPNDTGAIVIVSSVHALATSANIAGYAASKGAILALSRALAIELAPRGIRVNAVLPGAVDTPMLEAGLLRGHVIGKELRTLKENLAARHLLGRLGRPQEIAEAIFFLGDSDRSSFITGQALVVDGGATARLSTE
jgi:NAD(P)-dependent dehydrogenase (short-subunit alcohol dehydrogenase family)